MKRIFISPLFWAIYSLVYFVLMMTACVIANGHMIGGGGVIYGLTADIDAHFEDWGGMGIYPSPIDKYTHHILLYYCGPFMLIFGIIVTLTGALKNLSTSWR